MTIDTEGFQWVTSDTTPTVKWGALHKWLDERGRLLQPTALPEMGVLTHSLNRGGFLLVGNEEGEVVFVRARDYSSTIDDIDALAESGFISQETLTEVKRQVEEATRKRDEGYLAMNEKEASEAIQSACFGPPIQTLKNATQSIDSWFRINRLPNEEFCERISEIRSSTSEVERLQKLSEQELFEELLAKTIDRITKAHGADPESNGRLATLQRVATPLELHQYFREWER